MSSKVLAQLRPPKLPPIKRSSAQTLSCNYFALEPVAEAHEAHEQYDKHESCCEERKAKTRAVYYYSVQDLDSEEADVGLRSRCEQVRGVIDSIFELNQPTPLLPPNADE
jgi:hypothetical protein